MSLELKIGNFQATGRWWILHRTSHNLPKPSGVGNSFGQILCSISRSFDFEIYINYPRSHKFIFQVEHYTRDADGLCVNLRKPCVQVRFPLFSLKFLQNLMKSKLAQFPPVLHGPISGAISGARVSPLGPSASHRAIFISTYISHPRICQPAQWESFFTPYHLNLG